MSDSDAEAVFGKGQIPRAFATLEQIAADESFRTHFPNIKVQIINAIMLKMAESSIIVPDNEELGRRVKVYSEILRMFEDLGRYSMMTKTDSRKFPKLKDPKHT